ncbi:hypothetical protein ACFWXI_25735 [[Kitasatospora] papulosa]|uniref:tetratricopeptide repeat protein n=1 Tax=[Kitasatospora] papulosa TaxID=1464011 RepID=UPI0036C344A3
MTEIAELIKADSLMPDMPSKDTVNRCLASPTLQATPHATLAVGRMLARLAWKQGHINLDEEEVVKELRALWGPASAVEPLGRPAGEWDASALGVSAAITAPSHDREAQLPDQPAYIARNHDRDLAKVLEDVQQGTSRVIVLHGNAATGKTRACWEAVRTLGSTWRLWQPLGGEGLAEVEHVGPRTVVWLDEIHQYLLTPGTPNGERLAAALQGLLDDAERGPVLIVGTTWQQEWGVLTGAVKGRKETPRAHALLSGNGILLSHAFTTDGDMRGLGEAAKSDSRLAQAAERAEGGQVIQYLAGGPAQLDRYRSAPDGARAVIEAAMDARRLGFASSLQQSLFVQAAHGYLTDQQLDALAEDWLDQALEWASEPLRGVPGPLTRMRPRPGTPSLSEPHYRVADFVEEHGRTMRGTTQVPEALWDAMIAHATDSNDIERLVESARSRSHFGYLVQLRQKQVAAGDHSGLSDLWMTLDRADEWERAAELLGFEAEVGSAEACLLLAEEAAEAGDSEEQETWLSKARDLGSWQARIELAELLAERDAEDPESRELIAEVEAAAPEDEEAAAALVYRRLHVDSARGASCPERLRREADAGDAWAAFMLSYALEDQGAWSELEELLLRMTRDRDASAMSRLVALLKGQGRYAAATEVLKEAVEQGMSAAEVPLIGMLKEAGEAARVVESAAEYAEARLRSAIGDGDKHAVTELLKLFILTDRHDEIEGFLAAQHPRSPEITGWSQVLREAGLDAQRMALHRKRFEAGDSESALELFYSSRASEQDVQPLIDELRHRSDAGDLWALCIQSLIAYYTGAEHAEVLMRRSISCGNALPKAMLLTLLTRPGREREHDQLLRYGLAPDGRTADPFV